MARRGPFEPWEGSFEPNFGEIRIPRPPRRFWVGLGVIASVIALLLIARPIIDFLANLTWYQALGLAPVFTTRVEMQWGLFFAGLLIAMAYFVVNIWIALKLRSGPALRALGIKGRSRFRTVAGAVSLGVALVLAVLLGAALGSSWEQFALYIHQTPSGSPDPILGMNVSFYILALPMLEAATAWLLGLTFLTALLVAILYVWKGETFDLRLSPRSLGHLSATVGPLGLTLAAQTWLGRYDLLSAHNGFVWGAGYTDVHIRMGLMTFATVVLVLSATGLIANYWVRRLWLPILAVGVWIIMGIVGAAVPSLVQKWVVAPSEQGQEKTFINYQIAGTRQAFDLNKVTVQNYPYQQQLTADQVTADQATIDNLRLWDDRPLTDTYNQLQSIRTYYTFNQINLDRYTINGKYQQLEISARELDTTKLPAAPTWQSQHLIYTHGYGVAASPVSAVVGQGEPDYVSSDIPPTGPLTVTQPALYFGQKSDNYVLAPSRTPEFDYPQGSNDQYTSYKGTHGVPMTDGNKLLWSLELNDLNLLISSEIQPKTELLFRRDVQDRISEVAPFLTLDQSPYMVVSDGKLYWVQDAYTTASSYPYSQQEQLGPNGTVNYIRNSVKIVMDAYEGSMSFYVSDPTDPII
ncbi:MAG TPA: UPF0182 family protein, partial [Candidatus Dormibacteraeota bacterium]|nr:UPF0182 family protein [Candidatus Dormibacteraeota bacterium]